MGHWTELVQRIVGGDRAAEVVLVNRILPAIRVMIRRRGVSSWADVSDLAQDAFADLLVALRANQLLDPEKLPAFASRLVHNMCVDEHKRQRILVPIAATLEPVDPLASPPSKAELRQNWALVIRAIQSLSVPRDRTVLVAFYIRGEEKAEICAKFALTPDQFDRVIHRARDRVRHLVLTSISEESKKVGT